MKPSEWNAWQEKVYEVLNSMPAEEYRKFIEEAREKYIERMAKLQANKSNEENDTETKEQ